MSCSQQAVEAIVATIPKFRPQWQKFLEDWRGEETPWYLAMGEIAHYVVEQYELGERDQLAQLFSVVEAILNNADNDVQNLIWVGLFEDIQNIGSHRSFGADAFRCWLGPASLFAWDEVDRGMKRVVGWASQERARSGGDSFDAEAALSRTENPELRKIIEQMYRKTR